MLDPQQPRSSRLHAPGFPHRPREKYPLDLIEVFAEIESVAQGRAALALYGITRQLGECGLKILGLDRRSVAQHGGLEQRVVELPHVARPTLLLDEANRAGSESNWSAARARDRKPLVDSLKKLFG
jgi:hypothetical protein